MLRLNAVEVAAVGPPVAQDKQRRQLTGRRGKAGILRLVQVTVGRQAMLGGKLDLLRVAK